MSSPPLSQKTSSNEIVDHRRRNAYSVLRLIVFAAIALFVALTLWKGIAQLREANASLEQQIDDLKARLVTAEATDDMRSALLRLEGNRLTPANIGWTSMGLAAGLYGLALICSAILRKKLPVLVMSSVRLAFP